MSSPTSIDYSPIESEILGLKVGRCNHDYFNEKELYDQIVANNYDLCRLKVPAEDEMAALRLDRTGLPYFFSGSIRKYKTKISAPLTSRFHFNDLIFEMYDGSQDQLLKDMLIGTWGTYPIGYYRTPYLNHLVDKTKEIECVFQYYKKFNLNSAYPNNKILFIRHGDNYVGFFALNIINNDLESHIGGILEPYRKSRYFLDKLHYIKEFCLEHHLEHFIFGARNENSEVQRIFQYVGFQPIGSDNVFHIPSLLTYSNGNTMVKKFTLGSSENLYDLLHKEASTLAKQHTVHYSKISFCLNDFNMQSKKEKINIRFSMPIISQDELLIVLRDESIDKNRLTGYYRAYK